MEEELEITNEVIEEELRNIEANIEDSVKLYIKEISKYKLLEEEQQQELLKQYQETKDKNIKEKIIKHNLRLCLYVAKKYTLFCQSMTLLDLIQECSITLMDIIERYDSDKGFKLSTYAVKAMERNLKRQIDNQDDIIRKPIHVEEQNYKYKKYKENYYRENNINPTDEEIKDALGITDEKLSIHKSLDLLKTDSLNRTIEVSGEEGNELENFVEYEETGYSSYNDYIDMRIILIAAKQILNKREYYILYNRIIDENRKTLEELGKEFNFTRERVRQVENKAIKKLRLHLKRHEQNLLESLNLKEVEEYNIKPLNPKDAATYYFIKEKTDDITYYFFYNMKENNYDLNDFAAKLPFLQKKEIKELYDFCSGIDENLDDKTKNRILEELKNNYTLTEIYGKDIEPKQDLDEYSVIKMTPREMSIYSYVKEKVDDITYYIFYHKRKNNFDLDEFEKLFKFLDKEEIKELYNFCDKLNELIDSKDSNLLKEIKPKYKTKKIYKRDINPAKSLTDIKNDYQKNNSE